MCPQAHVLAACPAGGATLRGCQVFRWWVLAGRSLLSHDPTARNSTVPFLTMVARNSETRKQKDYFSHYAVSARCFGHRDTGVVYTQAQRLDLTLSCLLSFVPPDEQAW